MATIRYEIDGTEYSFEANPTRGDLNQLYRQGDRVAEEVASHGYEFTGAPPSFNEMSRAHHRSPGDVLDLGDISDRVQTGGTGSSGGGEGHWDNDESDGSGPGGGRPNPAPGSGGADGVSVTLVGPRGQQTTRQYDSDKHVGAVLADIQDEYDVDKGQQVQLYQTEQRSRALPSEAPINDHAGDTLYWDTESLL